MATRQPVSIRSLGMFAVAGVILVLFAFIGMRQFRSAQKAFEAAQTPSVELQTQPKEAVSQVHDVAREDWKAVPKKEPTPDSTVNELVQAWNKGDADKIAALFLPDGILRIPTGSEIKSREEIKNTIAKHRSGALSETTLSNSVEKISNADGENAVVKGTYQLNGIRVLGFSTSSKGSYEIRETKQDGRWLIRKAEVTRE